MGTRAREAKAMNAETQSYRPGLRERLLHWLRSIRFLDEFERMDPATRAQVLKDMDLTPGDVEAISSMAMNTDGLDRVLDLLKIDRRELETHDPELVAALRRSCAKCRDWRECARDLDAGAFSADIERYCMNKEELRQMARKE
jgi:hypothetical protein